MYFGTRRGGLTCFDGEQFTSYSSADGLVGDDVYALIVNRAGELVVGTMEGGVCLCEIPDLSSCRTITSANGLRVDNVLSLFEDREGILWVGLNNGVSKEERKTSDTQKYGRIQPRNKLRN